ncbi:MAG: hypothetical protein HQM15_06900 [Deltaproteobacteria bacterium]|nr:hypothetical protein [Deltaproteobacteria bacterium]
MGKIRRGNYIFISWIGDHGHHVHVYKDQKEILKWDLQGKKVIKGKATRNLIKIIEELQKEGLL